MISSRVLLFGGDEGQALLGRNLRRHRLIVLLRLDHLPPGVVLLGFVELRLAKKSHRPLSTSSLSMSISVRS